MQIMLPTYALFFGGCGPLESEDQNGLSPAVEVLRMPMVCASGETIQGIDVSTYQGTIDWDRVANAGIKFAFIRASDSTFGEDGQFARNWREARRVGILRGAYQFFRPNRSISEQTNVLLDLLDLHGAGELPPVLDIEQDPAGEHYGLSRDAIASAILEWREIIEGATGTVPIVYTNSFWNDWVGDEARRAMGDAPLWVANWFPGRDCAANPGSCCPTLPSSWSRWDFHQYTADGVIPGIDPNVNTVDLNLFNGSFEDLQAFSQRTMPMGGRFGQEPFECAEIPISGGVVDELGDCFFGGGDPMYWRSESVGANEHLYWTHTTASQSVANYARWDLNFAEGGLYRLEAYIDPQFAARSGVELSGLADYMVRADGTVSSHRLSQADNTGWAFIADLDFIQGADQWVRIDDNTGEENARQIKLIADALRFTRIDVASESMPVEQQSHSMPGMPTAEPEAEMPAPGSAENPASTPPAPAAPPPPPPAIPQMPPSTEPMGMPASDGGFLPQPMSDNRFVMPDGPVVADSDNSDGVACHAVPGVRGNHHGALILGCVFLIALRRRFT